MTKMNNKEFAAKLSELEACVPAMDWVLLQGLEESAEATWLRCDHQHWMLWLVVRLGLWNKDTRWHLVQTVLNELGAEAVEHYMINTPLSSPERHRVAYARARAYRFEWGTRTIMENYLLDCLECLLREGMNIHAAPTEHEMDELGHTALDLASQVEYISKRGGCTETIPDLSDTMCHDIRHTVGWYEIENALHADTFPPYNPF